MLIKDLIDFGLTEKEARAYLALLELEVAGVQKISDLANLNRSSTYVTLESLIKKGLVNFSADKKVREYTAISPEAILRIAEESASKKEQVLKKIESILPEMKALYKGTKKKPVVNVYEGKVGLINVFNDSLKNQEKIIRIYSNPYILGQYIYEHIPKYVAQRLKLGIKMYGIHPDTKPNRELIKNIPRRIDHSVLIPVGKINIDADLAIYDNKISYMTKDNGGLGIIIESKEMANVMKMIFDLAFKEAKRLYSKK